MSSDQPKQSRFALMAAALICKANGLDTIADQIVGFAQSRDWLAPVPTVTLGEAWRPYTMAEWYAKAGLGSRNSLHMRRLALDLNLFRDLDGDGDLDYIEKTEYHKPLGIWWESCATADFVCTWGGRFQRSDGNHYSVEHKGVR